MSKKKKSPVPGVPDEIRAYMTAIGARGCTSTGRKGLAAFSPEKRAEVQAAGRAKRKANLEAAKNTSCNKPVIDVQ